MLVQGGFGQWYHFLKRRFFAKPKAKYYVKLQRVFWDIGMNSVNSALKSSSPDYGRHSSGFWWDLVRSQSIPHHSCRNTIFTHLNRNSVSWCECHEKFVNSIFLIGIFLDLKDLFNAWQLDIFKRVCNDAISNNSKYPTVIREKTPR